MLKVFSSIFLLLAFNVANADWSWMNGDWNGTGVEVTNVYLQWDQHWVAFKGGDDKHYYYYWGTESTPGEKGKMFFSMLLTAFTAGKKVSLYMDEESSHGGWNEYTFINLHN